MSAAALALAMAESIFKRFGIRRHVAEGIVRGGVGVGVTAVGGLGVEGGCGADDGEEGCYCCRLHFGVWVVG